jgi:hypothetical protein
VTPAASGDKCSGKVLIRFWADSVKFRLALLGAVAASFIAGSASAGTLSNASVTLSASNVSTPTTLTVAYTTETAMGSGSNTNILIAAFPGLALSDGACTNGEVAVSVGGTPLVGAFPICGLYNGNSIQISLPSGVTVPSGSNVVVTIPSTRASTGPTLGSYSANMRTAQSSGVAVDTPVTAPTYSFGAAPTPVPTMTEWAMILFGAFLAGAAALDIQRRRQLSRETRL